MEIFVVPFIGKRKGNENGADGWVEKAEKELATI